MTADGLSVVVLLREVLDPRPPVRLAGGGVMVREPGPRRLVNPADLEALEEGLVLAEERGARVTAAAVGPGRCLDDGLRLALAMGAHRAVRVDGPGLWEGDAAARARVLARVVEILSPSIVLAGARLLDRGDEPAPALAAAGLGLSCCAPVVSIRGGDGQVTATRKADRGAREVVSLPLPCVLLIEGGAREPRYPDMDGVLGALGAPVETWGLPELGLPERAVGEYAALLRPERLAHPRPDPTPVPTPDPEAPAFERIRALLSGGIRARAGRVHEGTPEEVAEGLLRILEEEGLLQGASS